MLCFWDITVADTMAPSYAIISSVFDGLVAKQSSTRKVVKYSELVIRHFSLPIATESFGPIYAQKHLLFFVNLDISCL